MITYGEFPELVKLRGFIKAPEKLQGNDWDLYLAGVYKPDGSYDDDAEVFATLEIRKSIQQLPRNPQVSFIVSYSVGCIDRRPFRHFYGEYDVYGESLNEDAKRILEILQI